jgi:hypothetical protein
LRCGKAAFILFFPALIVQAFGVLAYTGGCLFGGRDIHKAYLSTALVLALEMVRLDIGQIA